LEVSLCSSATRHAFRPTYTPALGADEITARLHTPLTITHDIVDQMDQERQNSQNNQPLHMIVL